MTFCSLVIEENKSNQAILFTAVDKMLNRLAPKKLPQDGMLLISQINLRNSLCTK